MTNHVQEREALCLEAKGAFEQAGVGAVVQNSPSVHYAVVMAYINHRSEWHSMGQGWQRQAHVFFLDGGEEIEVFMSGLYRPPEGKGGRDVEIERLQLLFKLPRNTPGWADEIVSRVRQASRASIETFAVKVVQLPPPPIALDKLVTLADLIDAHKRFYLTDQYHAWLKRILTKLGKVHHKHEEWSVEFGGHLCHTETAAGSAPVTGPDGEPVIYTNAAYVKLDAYRDLIEGQSRETL